MGPSNLVCHRCGEPSVTVVCDDCQSGRMYSEDEVSAILCAVDDLYTDYLEGRRSDMPSWDAGCYTLLYGDGGVHMDGLIQVGWCDECGMPAQYWHFVQVHGYRPKVRGRRRDGEE